MTAHEAAELVVDLTREIASVRGELATYRLIAVQAIHALHDCHVREVQREARHERLLEEYRDFRARVMSAPERVTEAAA